MAAIAVALGSIGLPSGGGTSSADAATFISLVPARVMETRPDSTTADGRANGIGIRNAGSETPLDIAGRVGVPADAEAVVLNVAVTGSDADGYVTVWPCGQPRPLASSLNYSARQTISNNVTAQVGSNGQICIFTFSRTHVIVDVTGAYPSTSSFNGLLPGRILETRPGERTVDDQFAGGGIREASSVLELPVRNRAGAGNADAAVLNVAVTGSTTPGFVTVYPCGERPNAASLNYEAGQTISNSVTAKLSGNGTICVFVLSRTHVIIDVTGTFTGPGYNALAPARVFESRPGFATADGRFNGFGIRAAGSEARIRVAGRAGVDDVDAAVLNVAVTGSSRPGFVTVYPCGSPRPNASSLNFAAGQTISNAVTAKVGALGAVCVYVFAATHVIIDVNGYFPSGTLLGPLPENPSEKPRFQAVLAIPSDGPSQAGIDAEYAIDNELQSMVGWYTDEMIGVRPDFVRNEASEVDVRVITLSMTRAQIASLTAQNSFQVIGEEIKSSMPVSSFPVIFYDGTAPSAACGASRPGYLLFAMGNTCNTYPRGPDSGYGFGTGPTTVIAHEMAHALGAEGSCTATFQDGHESVARNDILYTGRGGGFADQPPFVLDVGKDDYFGHDKPGCPNIADSPLLTGA